MESEPVRGRASLLTTARVTPWRSSRPLSSEDDIDRCRSPAGNRAGVKTLAFESPVFLHLAPVHTGRESSFVESEPARVAGAAPKADERASVTVRVRRSPLLEDAPPARQRALNTRGGRKAAGLDTSVFRWPRPSRSTGPL